MKFLVLGCRGMAGHMISMYLRERGHDVTGFDRIASPYLETVIGDAMDGSQIKELVRVGKYDSVINSIGVLNRAAEEDKAAVGLNAYLPHLLEKVTEDLDTQVIHMSTDCVFSGDRGSYAEGDLKDGRTFYDRSKALGELENSKDVTLRNSIVGPDINPGGIGLLNWFLQQKGPVKGYRRAIWTGQTTLQLAKTMEEAAKQRVSGLYNMVPDRSISKYELICLFNQYIRKEQIEVVPDDAFAADKSLKRTKFEGFPYRIPDYEKMVYELGNWMRDHRDMYPHYDL